MDKQFMLVIIVAMVLLFSGVLTSEYLSSKDNKIMTENGIEQCLDTPDWSNSSTIWVRSCDNYMKYRKSVQEKD